MIRSEDDPSVVHPEVLTLHWEGPAQVESPPELRFPDSDEERREALARERERELAEIRRSDQGRAIWLQIEGEARRRGDPKLWERKLHAYGWVKMHARGSAADYARRYDVNHATVRTWIADVAKLAYEVGYRLHEDRLLLVGEAPVGLKRLRELVNADAASAEAWQALAETEAEFRGEDPYFHLNEGHVLRARKELRASDATLREGLTIAEARRVRALLWNARGQTFWDCTPRSSWPLPDAVERASRAFRRAVALDPTSYFPFVNLAQLAVDEDDLRRAEYWVGELSAARKRMDDAMKDDLARYLRDAEWSRRVSRTRFWRSGPARWIRELGRAAAVALLLVGGLAASSVPAAARADEAPSIERTRAPEAPARRGGAGGNCSILAAFGRCWSAASRAVSQGEREALRCRDPAMCARRSEGERTGGRTPARRARAGSGSRSRWSRSRPRAVAPS